MIMNFLGNLGLIIFSTCLLAVFAALAVLAVLMIRKFIMEELL